MGLLSEVSRTGGAAMLFSGVSCLITGMIAPRLEQLRQPRALVRARCCAGDGFSLHLSGELPWGTNRTVADGLLRTSVETSGGVLAARVHQSRYSALA